MVVGTFGYRTLRRRMAAPCGAAAMYRCHVITGDFQ
jgi:hypothetical protein